MQVDMQPALLMSQSESPPLQYGMPKDYWKSARDNINSQLDNENSENSTARRADSKGHRIGSINTMTQLQPVKHDGLLTILKNSTSIQTTQIIMRKCVLIEMLY